MVVSPSTHDKSSALSFGEQPENDMVKNLPVRRIEESFVMIEDTIEDSPWKDESSPINDGAKAKRAEQPAQPTTEEVLNKYPHLVVKLCDGEIVNANNGERIANLSQFLAANNLPEPARSESDPRSPLSPLLLFNSDEEVPVDPNQQSDQENTSHQRPGQDQTLAQLNHSLVDLDETAVLVINETMSQDPLLSQPPSKQLSQLMLGHEENFRGHDSTPARPPTDYSGTGEHPDSI